MTTLDHPINTWSTFDPEDDVAGKFGESMAKRARRRTVTQPGNWAHNRWLVLGDTKLGDAYSDYTVSFNGRHYTCSCREHAYGEYRKLCSHVVAVILFRKGHRAVEQGEEVELPQLQSAVEAEVEVDPLPLPSDPMWGDRPWPAWVTEFRPHQVQAVEEIVEAFKSGREVVFLDAPTGSGKTLIGEMVRRRLGVKALYVCSTKSLQDQALRDFPYAVVLKGRANYPTADHPDLFDDLDAWGNRTLTAAECTKRMADLPACNGCPPNVKGTRMHCDWCHPTNACPYQVAKSDALGADLAVLNTSYLLAEANSAGTFSALAADEGDEPAFGLVIVDEADLLENELMNQVEVRISQGMQKKLGISAPEKKTVESSWVAWLEGEALPKVDAALRKLPARSSDVKKVKERRRLERLLGRLKGLSEGLKDGSFVYTGYDVGEIAFKPVTVHALGKSLLWKHAPRWLVMSATIIEPRQMAESLGLVEA